jgi:DeoR/GlpR family transcriptional regulator of sugar metabolism
MRAYERKLRIMKLLQSKGQVNINQLAEVLGVSRVSVRSDLDALETRGLLVRTHGGAVLPENRDLVRQISRTVHEMEAEKEAIGRLAAGLVEAGSTVLIDAGSTTAVLARFLRDKRLTVITNSIPVLQQLIGAESIELLVSGGALRRPDLALIGEVARSFYEQVHADILFLGATGFSPGKGVSCANLIEAQTKKHMLKSAERVCLLADSSKLGKNALAQVCGWEDIDVLVTDHLGSQDRAALTLHGVEIITPKRKEVRA